MPRSEAGHGALPRRISRQVRVLLLGLFFILVPLVFAAQHVKHAHKSLSGVATKVAPGIALLGGALQAALILLLLLAFCWVLGWAIGRTRLGRRWIEWEKAKLLPKTSPALRQEIERVEKSKSKTAPAPPPPVHPALVHVEGGWQPGLIVEAGRDGWSTVFVPAVPDLTTGRLFCFPPDRVRRMDVPLEDFRKQLQGGGYGTADWLAALAGPDPLHSETQA